MSRLYSRTTRELIGHDSRKSPLVSECADPGRLIVWHGRRRLPRAVYREHHYVRALHKVIDEAGILCIFLVLDARDPEGRLMIEEVRRREGEGEGLVFIFNKVSECLPSVLGPLSRASDAPAYPLSPPMLCQEPVRHRA